MDLVARNLLINAVRRYHTWLPEAAVLDERGTERVEEAEGEVYAILHLHGVQQCAFVLNSEGLDPTASLCEAAAKERTTWERIVRELPTYRFRGKKHETESADTSNPDLSNP